MAELTEKEHSDLGRGRISRALIDQLSPILEDTRLLAIASLKVMYRSGESTLPALMAKIAELCALDDLENKLKQNVSQSEALERKITDV